LSKVEPDEKKYPPAYKVGAWPAGWKASIALTEVDVEAERPFPRGDHALPSQRAMRFIGTPPDIWKLPPA
jgi:hypothetical protein